MSHPQDQGQCVLDGYFECAAKIPEACICAKMPKDLFLGLLKQKYGETQPVTDGIRGGET
jgi:hypothetical protein